MSVQFETRTFDVVFSEDNSFDCTISESEEFNVDFGDAVQKEYQGTYQVTPSDQTQTLYTANRILSQNITIDPVPNNYGLIGWDGSTLTVS